MNSSVTITLLFIWINNSTLAEIWTSVPPWNRVWSRPMGHRASFFKKKFIVDMEIFANIVIKTFFNCWKLWKSKKYGCKISIRFVNSNFFIFSQNTGWQWTLFLLNNLPTEAWWLRWQHVRCEIERPRVRFSLDPMIRTSNIQNIYSNIHD